MLTKFDKALAALLVSFGSSLALHFFGWQVSPETQAAIVTGLTTLFVWLVPNKTVP